LTWAAFDESVSSPRGVVDASSLAALLPRSLACCFGDFFERICVVIDFVKIADDADAVLTQLGKFASLISALVKAWQAIALANGGDMEKAGDALERHLTAGSPNASALAPDAKG
jgi:hypothetical protein